MMTKKRIYELLAPTINWGIRLLILSAVVFGFAWYFEVSWSDFKDLIVLIIQLFSGGV